MASDTSSDIENRSIPGIDSTSSRKSSPAVTNIGWISCEGERLVSRTSPRSDSVRRRRRMRVAGNGIEASLGEGRVPFSAVRAQGLVKRYGSREALRGVDFAADAGELVAVIGPNGAGKTTLLSILAGIAKPDAGDVSVPKNDVGWVPQQAALYRRLTVEENLLLFARLSGGNQQRINIAIGLLSRPVALLLDEPSVGLDPRQRARLWEFVGELAERGTTVIFSTHDIQEAERYGRRLLVLADGEGLFDGTPQELREAVRIEAPEAASRDFETAFVAFLHHRGH